jgi:predicted DNA-binding protein (MmcQ/YjbR family)
MNIESIREHCISKKGVTENFPFDEDTLVFKVMNKMFLLISISEPDAFNVKCDPELAVELRERYPCVQPGYHMNKKLWNTIMIDGSVSDKLLREWIDHSYDQVVAGLPKKLKVQLTFGI